jgi:hypothetical protein
LKEIEMATILSKLFGKRSRSAAASRRPSRSSFRPGLETLEERQVLSNSTAFFPGPMPINTTQWAQDLNAAHSGATALYLNFDTSKNVPGDLAGAAGTSSWSAFQAEAGHTLEQDIQEILFRTSEYFAPFNVRVQRIKGDGKEASPGSTIHVWGNPNVGSQPLGSTPFGSMDYGQNSPPIPKGPDGESMDPTHIPGSLPYSHAEVQAGGQSNSGIAWAVVHEAGHTFGLAHVRTDGQADPTALGAAITGDEMSYTLTNPVYPSYFANADFTITNWNNGAAPDPRLQPWSFYGQTGNQTYPVTPYKIPAQNSYTYLQYVFGQAAQPGNHAFEAIDPRMNFTGRSAVTFTQASTGGSIGWTGDYEVYKLSQPSGGTYQLSVKAASGSSVDPVLMLFDAKGNLVQYTHNGIINATVSGGQVYYAVVGALDDASIGSFKLNVSLPPPNMAGQTFYFTNTSSPYQQVGTLVIQGENVGADTFYGVYTNYVGVSISVTGSITGTMPTSGGLTTSNISFSGVQNGWLTSFSGTTDGTGMSGSVSDYFWNSTYWSAYDGFSIDGRLWQISQGGNFGW